MGYRMIQNKDINNILILRGCLRRVWADNGMIETFLGFLRIQTSSSNQSRDLNGIQFGYWPPTEKKCFCLKMGGYLKYMAVLIEKKIQGTRCPQAGNSFQAAQLRGELLPAFIQGRDRMREVMIAVGPHFLFFLNHVFVMFSLTPSSLGGLIAHWYRFDPYMSGIWRWFPRYFAQGKHTTSCCMLLLDMLATLISFLDILPLFKNYCSSLRS